MWVHGRDFWGGLNFSTDFEGFASPRINNFDLIAGAPPTRFACGRDKQNLSLVRFA